MTKLIKIKRQQIHEIIAEINIWDLTGSSEKIYEALKNTENVYLIKQYDKSNIIDYSWDWDEDDKYFMLKITRLENDKEFNTRMKKLIQIPTAKQKQDKEEYETYLKLKKKFDKYGK